MTVVVRVKHFLIFLEYFVFYLISLLLFPLSFLYHSLEPTTNHYKNNIHKYLNLQQHTFWVDLIEPLPRIDREIPTSSRLWVHLTRLSVVQSDLRVNEVSFHNIFNLS